MATRANKLARKCPNVVSANDPEVIVKLRITLRQGKIKLARIRAFGHLENALASERASSLPYSLPISLALVNREIELPRRRRQPTRAARLPSTITRLRREAAGLARIFWNENRKPTAATIAGSVQQNIVLVRLLDTLPRLDSVMENSYSI